MQVSGSQLAQSRIAQNFGYGAQENDDVNLDKAASADNIKQAYNEAVGKQPYYSLGGGYGGQGVSQFYQNIQEALEDMGLGTGNQVEVELDDPAILADHEGEYVDIDGDVFVDGASLTDVNQGQVGNCYLMAAVASIAHNHPELLEQLITDNGNGTYTVHFQGGMGDVTIDDDFAVYAGSENTLYAETNTGGANPELWVAIIEKAYAQGHGGFEETVGGRAHEALAELTGQDSFTRGNPASFSPKELQAAIANGQSVTASSLQQADAKKADLGTGIVSSHAYVVTDVRQNSKGEWEVVVYNPWGSDSATADGNSDGFTILSLEEFNDNFREAQVMNEPFADIA